MRTQSINSIIKNQNSLTKTGQKANEYIELLMKNKSFTDEKIFQRTLSNGKIALFVNYPKDDLVLVGKKQALIIFEDENKIIRTYCLLQSNKRKIYEKSTKIFQSTRLFAHRWLTKLFHNDKLISTYSNKI